MDFSIGFTGTRKGMTFSQFQMLEKYLKEGFVHISKLGYRPIFRHGDCVGADDQAANLAKDIGYWIHAHPGNVHSARAYAPFDVAEATLPFLERNRAIVDNSQYMVAVPKESRESIKLMGEPIRGSGTWQTIRYARQKGKHIYIIFNEENK